MVAPWMRLLAPVLLLALVGGTYAAASAQDMPTRVRGTLAAVEGDTLVIETRDGGTVSYPLKEGAGLFKVTPASLDDLKSGDFVGITSIEQGDQRIALETHVFSEDLRGTGEGHYAWDLVKEPNMMSNATVAEVKDAADGRTLEVEYGANEEVGSPAGSQTVMLPEGAPIVRIEKTDDRSLLEPGKEVFVMVESAKDGPPLAVAAVIGDEGAAPPM
ncbi:MAG: hypothetical protein R3349_07720 [Geminicoccaceae bacterium]|nr:hypothetical protein [Geminicoccaceae bacterium]